MKTRLAIFDFDLTLVNTPEAPTGHDLGIWNGKDWWASKASLVSPAEGGFYDGWINEEIVSAFKACKDDAQTRTVLITGRRGISARYVRRVLRANQLYGKRMIDPQLQKVVDGFAKDIAENRDAIYPGEQEQNAHEEYYCGDYKVTNGIHGTLGHKIHVINHLLEENKGFELVELWDDRKEHVEPFKKMAEEAQAKKLLTKCIFHLVYPPKERHQYAWVDLITLGSDGVWRH